MGAVKRGLKKNGRFTLIDLDYPKDKLLDTFAEKI